MTLLRSKLAFAIFTAFTLSLTAWLSLRIPIRKFWYWRDDMAWPALPVAAWCILAAGASLRLRPALILAVAAVHCALPASLLLPKESSAVPMNALVSVCIAAGVASALINGWRAERAHSPRTWADRRERRRFWRATILLSLFCFCIVFVSSRTTPYRWHFEFNLIFIPLGWWMFVAARAGPSVTIGTRLLAAICMAIAIPDLLASNRTFMFQSDAEAVIWWTWRALAIAVSLSYVAQIGSSWRDPSTDDAVCRACRYDLTGNVSGVCPECGVRIPRSPGGSAGSQVEDRAG